MIYTVTLNPALDYFMEYNQFEEGKVNRTRLTKMLPGGKGIMESRMMNRLEVENTALGFIGGFAGRFIDDFLKSEGSQTAFTPIFAETRINVKIKTRSNETSLDAAGPNLTDDDVKKFRKEFERLSENDSVVFAGTIPRALGETFYQRLIREVKSYGAEFAIDVDGGKLLETLSAGPIVVKPNLEELEEIFSVKFEKTEEVIPYGKKMLAMGAQNVIVSMAGDGALLFTDDKVYFAEPVKGIVKNSIGAGDSTMAGFLAEWSKSHDAIAAFKRGIACGTAKVFSEDMPSKVFLEKCFNQIKIKEISNGN
ncbi:1-phosphofructokinase [Lactococcus nasutitermitis]|uniref:Tagatose-6-phosphate kinase n=1 Tax=Lactococcus nasutitermitis TaxID=1652957 RepID=A0ABV9JCU0_9LACT|nr:1-phosphofructokinase [Lactococcus nasutitermitis]